MSGAETSPIVMVLITSAAALTLFAWWLSARNDRRTRALITYLKQEEESFWQSLPWLSRLLNPVGAIETYRRSGRTLSSEFTAVYEARKSGSRATIAAIVMAAAVMGIVPLGTAL